MHSQMTPMVVAAGTGGRWSAAEQQEIVGFAVQLDVVRRLVGTEAVVVNDRPDTPRMAEIAFDVAVAEKSDIDLDNLIVPTVNCCWRTSERSEYIGKAQPIV